MHEHYRIEQVILPHLEKAGFVKESENDQVDYCGSIRTIFVKDEMRVLLEWDGEEGFGFAEVWRNGEWCTLPTKVLESREVEFQSAIKKLCAELQGYLD
ncbi:hypothetical protein MARLIPOL_18153 [Marinobacter lipolyticus SM19]|uniref:Uncharacterized protein n=1 Tax=Marinobacter lipolyticus SM19 TaxID=1318628 RepID=R8AW48_9GAMM|nr:hypothetical protein [Marinobacter lipolyticus]EON90564.1 hypothetical protein MARLIPOL_18153 [Marinobacter lipolyticus SM19]